MNVTVVSEHRLAAAPDGSVWGDSGYAFWSRYLDVFDQARLVCRVRNVATPPCGQLRVDGQGVSVRAVPPYIGPEQYFRIRHQVHAAVAQAFTPGDAVILRVGSHLAALMAHRLRRPGAPYAVEVVGDPHDVFQTGGVDHPLRPIFRWWFTRQQKRLCAAACGAAYVTQRALQRRYPCAQYAVGVADVAIGNGDPAGDAALNREYSIDQAGMTGPWKLITVGSMAQPYKGIDVLIKAVAACRLRRLDVRLTVVGDGKHRPRLEELSRALQLSEYVRFVGALPGPRAVQDELDAADLFVLPSRTEGLPRALIEAMARGLPAVATRVGGVPELLGEPYLVQPGSVDDLAARIEAICRDPRRRIVMSRENVAKTQEYREDSLRRRRVDFYRHVQSVTEAWAKARGGR